MSLEKLEILLSYYGTGDDAPVNGEEALEEVLKEWESFSVMLADHYTTVKTEVLHDLASERTFIHNWLALHPLKPHTRCNL